MGTGLCPQGPAAEGDELGPGPRPPQGLAEEYAVGLLCAPSLAHSASSPLVAPGGLQGDLFCL